MFRSPDPSSSDKASAENLLGALDLVVAESLLTSFSELLGIATSITSLRGEILVSAGWQEVCTRFHRANEAVNRRCVDSDQRLGANLAPGEFRAHVCPSGLVDVAYPLYLGGVLHGRVHMGQFLYEEDPLDVDFFLSQAEEFGFDPDQYLASVRAVPRYSRGRVQFLMKHLVGLVEVVSQLSVAKSEVEASEKRYRELYERTPIGYQSLDSDGRLLQVNQTWLDTLGYSRDEVIGKWFGDFLAPHMVEAFRERFPQFVARGHTNTEFEMVHKNGEIVTIAFDGKIGYDDKGDFKATHCVLTNITERKRAEEMLRITEYAVDHAPDSIHWVTPEGRFVYVNDTTCERLGYTREELLDLHVWDITVGMRPEDRPPAWERIRQEGALTLEREYRTKSGEVFPVEIKVNYFEYGGRELNFALVRDVTERRRVEEETKRLRDFYELILTRVNDGIWVSDENDRLVYVNPGMERIAGVASSQMLGLGVTRDFGPETTDEFLTFYLRAKEEKIPVPYETRVVTPAGRLTFQSGWLIPRYEDGCYGGMICTIQDVTESRQAVDDLRDSEERYRRLFELESDAILLVDNVSSRILEANDAAVDLYGYTREEWLGLDYTDVSAEPEKSREAVARHAKGVPLRWHKRKDGTVFPVEITAAYLEWKGRSIHIAAMRDITERVEAEAELTKRDEQLRQSQKMEAVGQLAGGIAHDFNNLLTAILGYSDVVLSEPTLAGSEVLKDVVEIKRAAERAASLTGQILAFSRRKALRPTLVSLNDIVSGMDLLLRRTLGEDISVITRLDPDLGRTEVDVHQFEQVIMNLALNARDAMPAGGRLTLETGVVVLDEKYCLAHPDVEPGRYVSLMVADTGIGMDEETVTHMFEPFFTTKALGEGTGLGLSMVYGIVKQSEGGIDVVSEPGEGTSFTVYLPLYEGPVVEHPEMTEEETGSGGHETILVVEDEPALRNLVSRVLGGLGHEVLLAADAGEALEVVETRRDGIDLLVTDVVLPGTMQGNDLVRTVLARRPGLPVLYMSGYTRDAIVHAGRLDADVNFLEKPFSPTTLARAVREVLAGASRAAEGPAHQAAAVDEAD